MTARGGHNRGRVSSLKPRTVMSSIMRARNGLTGPGEVSEVIGGSLPSSRLLNLRCSGSDAPTVTRYRTSLGQNTLTLTVAPSARAGSFEVRPDGTPVDDDPGRRANYLDGNHPARASGRGIPGRAQFRGLARTDAAAEIDRRQTKARCRFETR